MRRRLLVVTLALMLLGSGAAEGNRTLTCSVSGVVAGCFVEAPVFALGAFEVAVGVDAQYGYGAGRTSFFAPYAILGWYAHEWAAWLEFALPESRIPVVGKPDPWRFGVRLRF